MSARLNRRSTDVVILTNTTCIRRHTPIGLLEYVVLLTALRVHLDLHASPHHSHHLRSHHLAFHSGLKTYLFHKSFHP